MFGSPLLLRIAPPFAAGISEKLIVEFEFSKFQEFLQKYFLKLNLDFKANPLGQRQSVGVVDGVGLPTHVGFPTV